MTPRQRAAAAGELTYLGGATCKYGHNGPRYTSTGECLGCRKRPDATGAAPPDPRLRDLSCKLHEVQTDMRQTAARMKTLLRKFDAEANPFEKKRLSEAVEREHNAGETLQRRAALLEMEIEAARPVPDASRLATLLAAAGATPTAPPVRFDLRPATKEQIEATRWSNCHDPDLVLQKAQMARDKMLRDEVRARLLAKGLGRPWTTDEGNEVRAQVKAEMNLTPLPAVEPDPRTEEHQARIDHLTKVSEQ